MKLLEKDPEDRPSISKLIKYAFDQKKNLEECHNDYVIFTRAEEEVSSIKFLRISKPKAMKPVYYDTLPNKPIFKENTFIKMNKLDINKPNIGISGQKQVKKRENKTRTIYPYKSLQNLDLKDCQEIKEILEERPFSSALQTERIIYSRPSTAKPSIRTIIKSNTVKINNYIPQPKTTRLKITVNDIMQYQSNNKKID